MEANVITVDGVRRPDYSGQYVLLEDRGDTMVIRPVYSAEELYSEIQRLQELVGEKRS